MNAPAATPFDDGFTTAKVWMLRLLGLVYCVAFLGARWQNIALLGADGLAPAVRYVDHLKAQNAGGSALDGFLQHPMIWWWVPPTDANMEPCTSRARCSAPPSRSASAPARRCSCCGSCTSRW